MVVAAGDLDLRVAGEQTPELIERFWWNDEIGEACRRTRNVHLREPVPVGCYHAHAIAA